MEEHAVLLRAYAKAQERCSRLLADQAAQIMRLRAALIVRDSALALAREALADQAHQGFQPPRRLLGLLTPGKRRVPPPSAPLPDLRVKAVLCVGRADEASALARQLVEISGGSYLHHDGRDEPGLEAADLEASLRAADLVICQTGCVSHGAYWRVQDHCKRTGKPCVLVDAAGTQPVHFVRRAEAPVASEAAAGDGG
ncbi:DUF2325 domain-containing protein [Variovorax ginsengisoli]|uniref:DUF2325 domain-containing protein n=1 Tax=Variovorax ginsengisoli TaxID=363844 RepID=A0ABT9S3H2_9BURK|nr:DUF2325 domain-containing protein [Variovorax ginsengisoli]MDP9898321.1 hypothetical protein [Variovorax ginsengisoli]